MTDRNATIRFGAVQDVFRKWYVEGHGNPVEERLLHHMWNDMKEIKPIPDQTEPGHWEPDENGLYRCPFCGYIAQYVTDRYCAECGARLKGADDGTS